MIGPATKADLPGIVAILNHIDATSHATFNTHPATVDERLPWFQQFAVSGPHRLLVARHAGSVLGYTCTAPYRSHEAFRETVETSIALAADARGQGLGTLLYRTLFDALAGEPIHTMVAGIALPNDASVALHRRFGFTDVGTFHEYALKNGHYISSLWMQRPSP